MTSWKSKIANEMVEYSLNFVYLAFFLVAFTWYRRLVLAAYDIPYAHYLMPLVEAAVLAKVIMIGDLMHLGRGLERTPLLVPTLYRTVLFSALVGLFSVLEHTVGALIHGKTLMEGLGEIADKGRYELLAQCVVIFGAFVPFFAFKELEELVGRERLRGLFWRRAPVEPE
ncbi:MAG TPA: hypothetical protein VIA61_11985 [Methylomirabilota bacterium]